MKQPKVFTFSKFLLTISLSIPLIGQQELSVEKKKEIFNVSKLTSKGPNAAPNRKKGEGKGPFKRLVIRGATVIDGTGGPPRGPMDIVIENNMIVKVQNVCYPGVPIDESKRQKKADY